MIKKNEKKKKTYRIRKYIQGSFKADCDYLRDILTKSAKYSYQLLKRTFHISMVTVCTVVHIGTTSPTT